MMGRWLHTDLQMGMLVVEEEWERDVNGGGGIPVLRDVWRFRVNKVKESLH